MPETLAALFARPRTAAEAAARVTCALDARDAADRALDAALDAIRHALDVEGREPTDAEATAAVEAGAVLAEAAVDVLIETTAAVAHTRAGGVAEVAAAIVAAGRDIAHVSPMRGAPGVAEATRERFLDAVGRGVHVVEGARRALADAGVTEAATPDGLVAYVQRVTAERFARDVTRPARSTRPMPSA